MFKKVKWSGLGHNERYLNLPVRIGLVFFPPANPDFERMAVTLFDLIYIPILNLQNQKPQ
jgi:hypothetical protein